MRKSLIGGVILALAAGSALAEAQGQPLVTAKPMAAAKPSSPPKTTRATKENRLAHRSVISQPANDELTWAANQYLAQSPAPCFRSEGYPHKL